MPSGLGISPTAGWSYLWSCTATRGRSSPPPSSNSRWSGDESRSITGRRRGSQPAVPRSRIRTAYVRFCGSRGGQPPRLPDIGACAPLGRGSCSFSALALEAVAEAPAFVAGVDDVRAMGQPVDDGLREPGVGEHLRPFPERQVRRDDQAAAFVSFGEDLEDEFGGAVGQGQVAQLVTEQKLGAGVACDDAGELAVALGFLELVRESGEGGEPDAAALVAGADR